MTPSPHPRFILALFDPVDSRRPDRRLPSARLEEGGASFTASSSLVPAKLVRERGDDRGSAKKEALGLGNKDGASRKLLVKVRILRSTAASRSSDANDLDVLQISRKQKLYDRDKNVIDC